MLKVKIGLKKFTVPEDFMGQTLEGRPWKLLKFVISLINFLLWSVIEIEMCFQGEVPSSSKGLLSVFNRISCNSCRGIVQTRTLNYSFRKSGSLSQVTYLLSCLWTAKNTKLHRFSFVQNVLKMWWYEELKKNNVPDYVMCKYINTNTKIHKYTNTASSTTFWKVMLRGTQK